MRLLLTTATAVLILSSLAGPARAEPRQLGRVILEVSDVAVSVPARLGLRVILEDQRGRRISPQSIPPEWTVLVTRDGAPVSLELLPLGRALEGELGLRQSGRHRYRGRVDVAAEPVMTSEPVTVTATAPIDFGVVRAGETVCRQLPDGDRGLAGRVIEGELPPGLRLWGGCLVAADSVEAAEGSVRAVVAVQTGRQVGRGLYEISYRLRPRLLTPRRVLIGTLVGASLVMALLIWLAVRRRRLAFGPVTALAWAEVERSPYRGGRAPRWRVIDLDRKGRAPSVVDVGELVDGSAHLAVGELKVRPAEGGLVEFVGPRREELRAITPDSTVEVSRHRLVVPYGSTVSFRKVAIAPLVGDDALAASRGATDFLRLPLS